MALEVLEVDARRELIIVNRHDDSIQANGHIAKLKVQIVRRRVIVKYALDTAQPSEMAESLLHALEESLGAFEKHRQLVLDQLKRRRMAYEMPVCLR